MWLTLVLINTILSQTTLDCNCESCCITRHRLPKDINSERAYCVSDEKACPIVTLPSENIKVGIIPDVISSINHLFKSGDNQDNTYCDMAKTNLYLLEKKNKSRISMNLTSRDFCETFCSPNIENMGCHYKGDKIENSKDEILHDINDIKRISQFNRTNHTITKLHNIGENIRSNFTLKFKEYHILSVQIDKLLSDIEEKRNKFKNLVELAKGKSNITKLYDKVKPRLNRLYRDKWKIQNLLLPNIKKIYEEVKVQYLVKKRHIQSLMQSTGQSKLTIQIKDYIKKNIVVVK